ncbi:MAG: hypothetical protein FWD72_03120 [Eggerthellaceae bacterium]|nr:hypothetical protein [Eggerthellaceae bacterium]
MKRTKTIRRAIAVCALVLAAVASLAMAACGQSDEQVIRDGVTKDLESVKQVDQSVLDDFTNSLTGTFDFTTYGITAEDFFKAWLSGFDYSVDTVTVNGSDATVSVTITCKSMTAIMSAWQTAVLDWANTNEAQSMTQDQINQKAGSMLMDAANSTSTQTTSINLPYTKNGNTWEPGSNFDNELGKAIG